MDLDSVGKFLINDPNVSHLTIVEGYHPMSPKKNGLNEKKGGIIQYSWKFVQCYYNASKVERVYQDTHLKQAVNTANSMCNFPSYVSHYQFLFKNRWYCSFLLSSGEKLAMCARDFVPYDGSPILRLNIDTKNKKTIISSQTKVADYPRLRTGLNCHVYFQYHKMVLLLFRGPNSSDCETVTNLIGDHKDRDRQNYKAWNLNYLTFEQNVEAIGYNDGKTNPK
jgi:hypothetical protein